MENLMKSMRYRLARSAGLSFLGSLTAAFAGSEFDNTTEQEAYEAAQRLALAPETDEATKRLAIAKEIEIVAAYSKKQEPWPSTASCRARGIYFETISTRAKKSSITSPGQMDRAVRRRSSNL
jgi:hypothetical protein